MNQSLAVLATCLIVSGFAIAVSKKDKPTRSAMHVSRIVKIKSLESDNVKSD